MIYTMKSKKMDTQKRVIYFALLFNILKSEGGDITCPTITVEAENNY